MMPVNPEKDTLKIIDIVYQRKRVVLVFAFAAFALGITARLLKPREYTAETFFILKNHLYADKTYLYSKDMRYINYYGSEDDIERLVALIESDTIQNTLISELNLMKHYKADSTSDKEVRLLKKTIAKKVKIMRTPQKSASLSYTDKSPEMAAKIANRYLQLLEYTLRTNYNSVRKDVQHSLQDKIAQEDRSIALLTDSLARMRKYYGIYQIINPARENMMLNGNIENNGHPEFAEGLELIQNLESIKDQAVTDRAEHISLLNQYVTGEKADDLSLIQLIKVAEPPLKPSDMGIVATSVISLILGAAFGIIYAILQYRIKQA